MSQLTQTIQQALMTAENGMRECGFTFDQANQLWRRQQIVASLERNEWHKQNAAKELKMHRNTMGRQIAELQIVCKPYVRKGRSLKKSVSGVAGPLVEKVCG